MVRQADYIYGVIPERGEYGFESKPADDDPAVLSRVQSITSSFQWTATASNDAEAIAVDRTQPPLVVHIVTDPRDPDGRRSLCMHIWITSETEPVSSMIAELWPRSIDLPISQDEFLMSSSKGTSGRIIVGPKDTFDAVGFDQSWGRRATTYLPASRSASRSIARANTSSSAWNSNNQKRSFHMIKVLITLCLIALLTTAGFAVTQIWEIERLQLEVKKLSRDGSKVAEDKELIRQQLDSEKVSNKEKTYQIATLKTDKKKLQTSKEELERQIQEKDKIIKNDPQKVVQAELQDLRLFATNSEKYVESQIKSLKEYGDKIPKSRSKDEGSIDNTGEYWKSFFK